jgi:hypothetical protein
VFALVEESALAGVAATLSAFGCEVAALVGVSLFANAASLASVVGVAATLSPPDSNAEPLGSLTAAAATLTGFTGEVAAALAPLVADPFGVPDPSSLSVPFGVVELSPFTTALDGLVPAFATPLEGLAPLAFDGSSALAVTFLSGEATDTAGLPPRAGSPTFLPGSLPVAIFLFVGDAFGGIGFPSLRLAQVELEGYWAESEMYSRVKLQTTFYYLYRIVVRIITSMCAHIDLHVYNWLVVCTIGVPCVYIFFFVYILAPKCTMTLPCVHFAYACNFGSMCTPSFETPCVYTLQPHVYTHDDL